MRTRCLMAFLMAAAAMGALPAFARGQGLVRIPTRTYIAINPLLIPFDIGSVEVESGIAPGATLGAVASYTELDSDRYTSFDIKLRYYPAEVVLRGFAVGLTGGYLRYNTPVDFINPGGGVESTRESLDAATIGIVTDYNWLIGPSDRFVVGVGLGAKRVLASRAERDRVNIDRAYGTARFVLGYAF